MKTNIVLSLLVVITLFSCKQEAKTAVEETPKVVKLANALTLSNYSDENWTNGVGVTYNMFLTDFSKENEALLKTGTELVFNDGSKVAYVGYEIVGNFIQIQLNEKATKFNSVASYPNEITIK